MRARRSFFIPILAAYLALAIFSLTSGHSWGDDFAAYLLQARSLVTGNIQQNIESSRFTIESSTQILGPVLYPWGYPLLIAPINAAVGLELRAYKTLNILFYLSFLVCVFIIFKRRLRLSERLVMVGVLGFSPALLALHDHILSDLPYLFFSTLSFLLMDRWFNLTNASSRAKPAAHIGQAIGLGAVCFAAYFLRANGLVLCLILLAAQILNYRIFGEAGRRNGEGLPSASWFLVQSIPYLVFGVLLVFSSSLLPTSTGDYIRYSLKTGDWWVQIKTIGHYVLLPSTIWHPWAEITLPNLLIGLPLLVVMAVGIWNSWRKDWLILVYCLFTLFLLFAYPFYQGLRFILPLLPFYLYFILKGLLVLSQGLSKRFGVGWARLPQAVGLIAAAVLLIQASLDVSTGRSATETDPFDPASQQMFQFIAAETRPDDVIIFFKPRLLRLLTGRESFLGETCESLAKGDLLVLRLRDETQQISTEELAVCETAIPTSQVFINSQFQILRLQAGSE